MLFTNETGNPNAPAILFLHGGGLSGRSWLPVIEKLPEFHCLAPDLPEQGRSHAIPYSIEQCVRESALIIQEKVSARKAHVVALSLGGPVAFSLVGAHPELVDHILISGGSGQIPRWLTAIAKSTLWMYRLYNPDFLVRATLRQQGIPEEYTDLVRADLRQSLDPAFMRRYMTELSSWRLPAFISQPLLLVVGQREPKAARTFARTYLKHYPTARGLIIPQAGHAWSLQFPGLFASLVRAWVSDSPLPPELKPLLP